MNPLMSAIQLRVRDLRDRLFALDELLTENVEAVDLGADKAARLLVQLGKLSDRLDQIADELGAGVDPQPVRER
jgi:hypothetical protein